MTSIKAKLAAVLASVALAASMAVPAFAYEQVEDTVSYGHGYSDPGYLVIHETANPGASAANHVQYWGRDDTYAVHYVMELDGSVEMCAVISCETIEGYGALYLVEHPEVGPLSVILADGVQFTPSDWQGEQCASADDAAEFAWVDARGNDAIMLDGLPRIMA